MPTPSWPTPPVSWAASTFKTPARWSGSIPGDQTGSLHGETVGIVGLGNIGSAFARRVAALETKVIACDPYVAPARFAALGVERVSLETLAERSDYVSVHTDLNPETRGLFGAEQFGRMKRTAVFVNTARGPVVDQVALANALRAGTIFAAGLDVTDPEPLPPEHELFKLPNCVIAPHIASATVHTRNEMARICAENLIAGLAGKPMTSEVRA